jgi:hypothetical protein
MEWQPIETAPKDESTILVWVKDDGIFGRGAVVFGRVFPSGNVKADGHKGDWLVTHWMPLPPPPSDPAPVG